MSSIVAKYSKLNNISTNKLINHANTDDFEVMQHSLEITSRKLEDLAILSTLKKRVLDYGVTSAIYNDFDNILISRFSLDLLPFIDADNDRLFYCLESIAMHTINCNKGISSQLQLMSKWTTPDVGLFATLINRLITIKNELIVLNQNNKIVYIEQLHKGRLIEAYASEKFNSILEGTLTCVTAMEKLFNTGAANITREQLDALLKNGPLLADSGWVWRITSEQTIGNMYNLNNNMETSAKQKDSIPILNYDVPGVLQELLYPRLITLIDACIALIKTPSAITQDIASIEKRIKKAIDTTQPILSNIEQQELQTTITNLRIFINVITCVCDNACELSEQWKAILNRFIDPS